MSCEQVPAGCPAEPRHTSKIQPPAAAELLIRSPGRGGTAAPGAWGCPRGSGSDSGIVQWTASTVPGTNPAGPRDRIGHQTRRVGARVIELDAVESCGSRRLQFLDQRAASRDHADLEGLSDAA